MGQKRAAVMYFTENGRKLAVQVKGLLESPGQGMAVQMGNPCRNGASRLFRTRSF